MKKNTSFYPFVYPFICLIISFFAAQDLYSQYFDPGSSGFKYMIVFPDTTINTEDPRFLVNRTSELSVYVYSPIDQIALIEDTQGKQFINLQGNSFYQLQLSPRTNQHTLPAVVQSKYFAVEVEDAPIVVYCFMDTEFGTEAWTPLPVENWGTDYYVAALHSEKVVDPAPFPPGHPRTEYAFDASKTGAAPSQALILASEDNTTVSINLNKTKFFKRLEPLNTPLLVTLNRGESYLIESWVDTLRVNFAKETIDSLVDLGGFRVTSDRPISVISGNTRSLGMEGVSQTSKAMAITGNTLKNLLIEALAPIEQHGKNFVYTPTMDSKRPVGNTTGKRKFQSLRVYATQQGSTQVSEDGYIVVPNLNEGTTTDYNKIFKYTDLKTHVLQTSKPTQVFSTASSVANMITTGSLPWQGTDYTQTYGSFMYEITPVEQWITLAPFTNFGNDFDAYINVVTTTENKDNIFYEIFTRRAKTKINFIPTSNPNYVWATIPITTGDYGIIEGINGAKFGGHVYGINRINGFESFYPGVAKKEDDKNKNAIQSGGKEKPMHPSEYKEEMHGSFSYPLAPSRNLINVPPDSLEFETESDCKVLRVKYRTVNQNAVGLRALRLEQSVNARMNLITPSKFSQVINSKSGEFTVSPVDTTQLASANVVIQDRTGKTWKFAYSSGEILEIGRETRILNTSGLIHKIVLVNKNFKDAYINRVYVDTSYLFNIIDIKPTLPVKLGLQDSITVMVFLDKACPDTNIFLHLVGNCRNFDFPLHLSYSDSVGMPRLFNVLQEHKWVCTKNIFTKNPIKQYDTTLFLYNIGNKYFTVDTAYLRGPASDSGIFVLGNKNRIRSGDIFYPNDTNDFRKMLDIAFLPKDEINYSAEFVIRTTTYDEFVIPILGSAIESHITATDYDFGIFEFLGKWKKQVDGEVYITANPTRKTTITNLKFVGKDAADFDFIGTFEQPTKEKPWVMEINETRAIPVRFKPEFVGRKNAQILIEGDFSLKDDSLIDLTGNSFVYSFNSSATNAGFGNILSCKKDSSYVKFVNTGTGAIILNKMTLNDFNNVFEIEQLNLPLVVAANETLFIKTIFNPKAVGQYQATIFYGSLKYQDKTPIPITSSELEGKAFEVKSSISTTNEVKAGHTKNFSLPLYLDSEISDIKLNKFRIVVTYDKEKLQLTNSGTPEINEYMLKGGLLYNWKFEVTENIPGKFIIEFLDTTGGFLKGKGLLLNLDFAAFIGINNLATVSFTAEHNEACISFKPATSNVTIEQFCGYELRQIEMTNSNYFMKTIYPNPATNLTEINFGVGLDGSETTMTLYNADGKVVSKILDDNLKSGAYKISLDVSTFASGIYYCKIISGAWSETKKLIITK